MRLLLAFLLLTPAWSWAQSSALKSPNVSGDTLFLYRNSNFAKENNSETRNGFDLQEAELAFYSDVDPYTRLSMLFTIHPDYKYDSSTNKVNETWAFEPEELYGESDYIPNVTLRAGKFKAAFGKHNPLHSHVYPFVNAPMINRVLLGDEGLNDVGVSAAGMLPVNWFSEFTAQYLRGEGQDGENPEFHSPSPGDGVGVAHWRNLWDLNDSLTMEAGVSYARGGNSVGGNTALSGADLTFKWRPVNGGMYHSAIFATEYIDRSMDTPGVGAKEHGYGLSTWGQYQFAQRWSAKARYETLQISNTLDTTALPNAASSEISAMVQFELTEFSFLRLEYDNSHNALRVNPGSNATLGDEHKIYLQANFVIGSHPAHAY